MAVKDRYNSWGRTRRPKNITGVDGTKVVGVTDLLAARTITDAISIDNKASPANGIYSTENQRYLHLHASGSSSGCDNVYTYLYATGQWSELVVRDSSTGVMLNTSVVCESNQHVIVEIAGADLIAFDTGSNSDGIYAAFSTF